MPLRATIVVFLLASATAQSPGQLVAAARAQISVTKRRGKTLPLSRKASDYLPGDIVAWDLGGGVTHIGIAGDEKVFLRDHYKIIHNIGSGVKEEDILFRYKIIGHYRYLVHD